MVADERIVAIGLLTQHDLNLLGTGFRRAYPVQEDTDFDDLLRAIDDADKKASARSASGERMHTETSVRGSE